MAIPSDLAWTGHWYCRRELRSNFDTLPKSSSGEEVEHINESRVGLGSSGTAIIVPGVLAGGRWGLVRKQKLLKIPAVRGNRNERGRGYGDDGRVFPGGAADERGSDQEGVGYGDDS
jgi:hypothetical protein